MKEYRLKNNVRAEQVDESGQIFTTSGPAYAEAGSYLIYTESGTVLMDGEKFESIYVEERRTGVEDEQEEEQSDEDPVDEVSEYNPADYQVHEVLSYMRENHDAIERIKELERTSRNRKTILSF